MSPHLSSLLTILLLMMATIPDQARSARKVSATTQAYVNARYEAAKLLIELNPQVYIFTVFRHFREHFANVGIGTRAHSHLPILLQDLDLMPRIYRKSKSFVDRMDLRTLHHVWELHNANQPDGDYFDSVVVIPAEMRELFVSSNREPPVQSLPYRQLLDQMEAMANQYPVEGRDRKAVFLKAVIKKYRFLAIFWLTVMDRYIRVLEFRGQRVEMNTFERTTLQFPERKAEEALVEPNPERGAPNGGPGQVAGPSVHAIDRLGTSGGSGVGTNPELGPMTHQLAHFLANPLPRLLAFPLAPPLPHHLAPPGPSGSHPRALGAPSSGTKEKANDQSDPSHGGNKKSRGGSMNRSVDGVSKSKLQVEQVHHHKRVQSAQHRALY